MFARALAVVIVVMVSLVGCGDGSTGPSPDIDPSLVGSWIAHLSATDWTGVFLCTYIAMRLVLHETGQFDWYTADSPPAAACEVSTFRKDSGDWRAQDGNIVFTPPPMEVEGATLELAYELVGDELHAGPIVFERE